VIALGHYQPDLSAQKISKDDLKEVSPFLKEFVEICLFGSKQIPISSEAVVIVIFLMFSFAMSIDKSSLTGRYRGYQAHLISIFFCLFCTAETICKFSGVNYRKSYSS